MPVKFVKGFCAAKNRYFAILVDQFGGKYEVVDFVDLEPSQAAMLKTQVKQDSFRVHNNLQACWGEQTRVVGSSSWPYGKGGCATGKYNFQCLYCNKMKIDYSSVRPGKEGEVVHLAQGQEIAITGNDGEDLKRVLIGAGWDEERCGHMDVDCSVVLAGQGCMELVYFGNLDDDAGSVSHHGDNLTGVDSDTEGQDDENIDINLEEVPDYYDRLIFFFNIYSGQMLSSLKNMYFRVADPDSGETLIDYKLRQGSSRDSAVVVAVVKRDGRGWKLKAIDENAGISEVETLAEELMRRY